MSNDKPNRREIEGLRIEGTRATEDMARLAERLGYRGKQLMLPNRTYLTSITAMMEDNPGLVEAMYTWIADNLADKGPDEEVEADELPLARVKAEWPEAYAAWLEAESGDDDAEAGVFYVEGGRLWMHPDVPQVAWCWDPSTHQWVQLDEDDE